MKRSFWIQTKINLVPKSFKTKSLISVIINYNFLIFLVLHVGQNILEIRRLVILKSPMRWRSYPLKEGGAGGTLGTLQNCVQAWWMTASTTSGIIMPGTLHVNQHLFTCGAWLDDLCLLLVLAGSWLVCLPSWVAHPDITIMDDWA